MKCKVAEFCQSTFKYEHISKGRVPNVRLQLEDRHLTDSILVATEALDKLRDIYAVHPICLDRPQIAIRQEDTGVFRARLRGVRRFSLAGASDRARLPLTPLELDPGLPKLCLLYLVLVCHTMNHQA